MTWVNSLITGDSQVWQEYSSKSLLSWFIKACLDRIIALVHEVVMLGHFMVILRKG